jgi:pyruvate dehydrogenase E1 component beta subunit
MFKTFNQEINDVLDRKLQKDNKIVLLGLGITDPKRFFGTTKKLVEKYGKRRVIECPTSENSYLGHGFGMSLGGCRPIIHFQRMDFMYYAFDQMINNIAKWNYMFGEPMPNPIIIRCVVGFGWGQGPQHSDNIAGLLAKYPGIDVYAPSSPDSIEAIYTQALNRKKLSIIIEHRWLQGLQQNIEKRKVIKSLQKCPRVRGASVTIICWSYSVVEAMRFIKYFPEIGWEIIDVISLSNINYDLIEKSILKTKKVIYWEPCSLEFGISQRITSSLFEKIQDVKIFNLHLIIKKYFLNLENIIEKINLKFNFKLKWDKKMRWPKDQDLSDWSPWG